MSEKRRSGSMGISVGGATLVMLFAVLCLTIFSVMALTTANHEWELAKKSAGAVTGYYAADCKAAEVMAALPPLESEAGGGLFLYVLDGETFAGVTVNERDGVVSYDVPIDEMQTLKVRLGWDGGQWRVLSWQVAQTGLWEADEGLDVWTGELGPLGG